MGHHIDFSYSKLDYICVRITAIVKIHALFHSDKTIHVTRYFVSDTLNPQKTVFKGGMQNQKGFWVKINCSQKKIIEWGGVKKCRNLTCKVNFLRQKSSESF